MAKDNRSATSSSPIKAWMKVAGGSTKSAFKEYLSSKVMPVTAEMSKELSESFKKTQSENKQGKPKKQPEIFRKLMQTPAMKNMQSVVRSGWKEVKRGNIFMIGADGGDDLGDDFGLDESSGGSTTFGGDDNAQMAGAYDEIGDRISDQTEATYKAAEVSMNATLMSSSAIIESQEKMSANIVSRLDNISSSLNTIATTQTDKMEKFFEAVTQSLDRMGVGKPDENPKQIPDDEGVFRRNAIGKSAGLNLKNYRKRVIDNLKNNVSEIGGGYVGALTAFASLGAENITADQIGTMLATGIMAKVFENNIGKLGKRIESVVADGIPRVVMGLTDLGNSDANVSKFAKIVGKIFGVDVTPNTSKPDVKFEGKAIPFDDQTKASIVNVIPKHLSEISEYTKLLAQSISKLDDLSMEKVRQRASVFDMNDGRYKSREDLTREVFKQYYDTIASELIGSEFGKGIQSIVNTRTGNIKGDDKAANAARNEIRESYDNVMKQVAMFMYANGNKGVDLRESAWIEQLGEYFKEQKYNQDEIRQLLEEIKTVAGKESVVNDMAKTRLGIYESGKRAAENLKHNPNLVDTFIVDDRFSEADMANAYTDLVGLGERRLQAAGFDRAKSSKTTNIPKTTPVQTQAATGTYNEAQFKQTNGDRGSDQDAADNASLSGSKSNKGYNDSDIRYVNDFSHEADEVRKTLGTEGSFSQGSQEDRTKERVTRLGEAGKKFYTKISTKIEGSGSEIAKAFLHGDTEKILESALKGIRDTALITAGFIGQYVISPAAKFIFGKKSDSGYREGGMLSGVSNKIHDMMQSVASRIDGKEWTDAKGKVHKPGDPEDSILNKAKATINGAANKFKEVFSGNDDKNKNEGTVVDNIRDSSKDLFSDAKRDIDDLMFGEGYSELDESQKQARISKAREDIKERTQAGIKGGLIGAGASLALGSTPIANIIGKTTLRGWLGKSVVGTAIVNPLVGAGIGFTLGFLSKSESFQRFFFGGEFTDKNGNKQWREGLIKKSTQEFIKQNKATIGVGAALGVGTSLFTGAKFGLFGNILGGPVAGAGIGIAAALTTKSKSFQTFLFGDEERGILGIKQQWAKLMGDSKTPSITKEGLKAAGFASAGAALSVKFGTSLAKHGLIPALFSDVGPFGLALMGMAGGLTLAHKDLKKFIFGEDFVNDEGELERKEGIIGKFTNALNVTLVQPVANTAKSVIRQINYQIAHHVLAPLRIAFYPFASFGKKLMGKITSGVTSIGRKITTGIDKYFLDPMKMFVRALTKPLARFVSIMGKAVSAGAIVTGNAFAKAVGLSGRLVGRFSMTEEEREEWKGQRAAAKKQRVEDRAKLRAKNREDRLANKDRATILKYTHGDYASDTSEARRAAERRAGRTIIWKNKLPKDGWYTGEGSGEKNSFSEAVPILKRIGNTVSNIFGWLKGHRKNKGDDPTVGYASGTKKVPPKTDYVANENSTKGTREVINIPRGKGKGSTVVEGRTGTFKVWNGGGETVHNGTEEQPIPILVTGYTNEALDQRDGVTVEVSKIDDKAKKTTTEAIDDSEAGIKSTIPQRFKDFSVEFGKSFFGPDWEPKKGGLYDIATSVIGDLAGAIFLPIAGLVKSTMAVAKVTLNTIRLGAKILTLPYKGAKWLGKKAFNLGKRGVNFAKRKIDQYRNGDHIDIKATLGGIASDIGTSAKDTATTVRGNRRYAKYKKLILSGDEFYKGKFDVYKDENGKEHIVAREDVQIDKNTIVHAGEELKDVVGAANLFKHTEDGFLNKIKRRIQNSIKPGNKEESEETSEGENNNEVMDPANPIPIPNITRSDKTRRIIDGLRPTNEILGRIYSTIKKIVRGNRENTPLDEFDDDEKLLPAVIDNERHLPVPYKGKVKKDRFASIREKLNGFFKNSPFSTYTKAKEDGSAAVVKQRKEEAEKNALIEVRENENNSLLKRLAENSDEAKDTRKSWLGNNGKLMKMFGIGALIAFGIYKFFGSSGLSKTIKTLLNVSLALLKSVWNTAGDLFYGMDNLTDDNDIATNIKETNVVESALTSGGGANIAIRSGMAGFEAISKGVKAGIESGSKLTGVKAGFKSLGESVKNGIDGMTPIKTQIKTAGKNLYNKIFKTGESVATKTETAGNYTGKVLAEAVAKHMGNANTKLAQYVAKADEAGVKSVGEMLLSAIKTVAEKVAGSNSTAVAVVEETTKSSVFKEILDAVKKSSAKILAKMSSKNSIKMISAAITFGTSDLGFITLGALNGLTGAARLFHVDEEDVDTLMVAISAAMGALTNIQVIGPFLDAASSVIADLSGFDLLAELACLLYRVIAAITGQDADKVDQAREKARKGYDEYKEKTIQDQYETYVNANRATLGNDYSYEDFIDDVNSGNLGVKVDSEISYNKNRNKTFFAKMMDGAGTILKGAGYLGYSFVKNNVGWIETVYVDNTNETIYRKNSGKWRAYKWLGNDQFANLGVIDKDNIPDTAERKTVRQVTLLEKMMGGRDGICSIPEDNGWTPWNPDDAIDVSGTVEADDELSSDDSDDSDENATLDNTEDLTENRKISDAIHATVSKGLLGWGRDVARYKNTDDATLKSLQQQAPQAGDADAAAFATINNDSDMVEVFGSKYSEELSNGLSADDFAKKYGKRNLDPFAFDPYDFEGLLSVDDPDELREKLKDYALFIRDLESDDYRSGFFLVHPNANSFIRFTASGNYFKDGYKWTSVLSAWISGMLQARKINNYQELINGLKDSGVNLDVVDPDEIVNDSEDEDSIFDVIGKAFKAMFSSFSTSWRRIMTSEEVDESMEKVEENWVDNVVGKKIVRPISEDGSKPTSKNFKAVTYLFYVIDGSKKFFREYNIFQTYTEMQVDVEVVKNWVKNSEAWIVKDETFTYDENGAPNVETIDPSDIKIYNPTEDENGILQLESEKADDEYTTDEREKLADASKLGFEGYSNPDSSNILSTFITGKEKNEADDEIATIAKDHIGPGDYLDTGNYLGNFIANTPLGHLARFAASDEGSPSSFAGWLKDLVGETPLGKAIKYQKNTTADEYADDMANNPIQWMLNSLGYGKDVTENHNTTLREDISNLIGTFKDFFKNVRNDKTVTETRETLDTTGLGNNYFETTKKDDVKGWSNAFQMFGIGGRGGFGPKQSHFSNRRAAELDKRYASAKASLDINDNNARTMSKLISEEDSNTAEVYNNFKSKNREEEVRKQLSELMTPTQVLMGMDGSYWVWDRTNTFHRYTYFGQDLQEELTNDEMLALYKNGRYLVKEKPLSYVNSMESALTSNLTTLSSNYNTGLSNASNSLAYNTSYISSESTGSNIYTTGATSTVGSTLSSVSSTPTATVTVSAPSTSTVSSTPAASTSTAKPAASTSTSTAAKSTTTSTTSKASNIVSTIKKGISNVANLLKKKTSTPSSKTSGSKSTKSYARGGFGDKLNGVPYFSQNDSRWKDSDYSSSDDVATMGDAGCGPAVLSMVDNFYGGQETPVDYARLAQETGYRDSSGTNWDFINSATRAMGLNTNQIENPDSSDIASELSTGQPVILSGTRTLDPSESPYTRSGHYVVATGLNDDGSVNISDPRGKSYSKKFSLDKLASETGSMWGFGGKGGFGKFKKSIKDRIKKKKIGGGRGTFSADQARQIMLKWISAFYQRVHYANVDATNMDAAYAGTGYGQTDCSGLQQYLYRRAAGIEINRDTRSQACNKYPVIDRSDGSTYAVPNWSVLKPGDLIYFCRLNGDINNPGSSMCHVEMYIGNTHSLGIGSPTTPGSRLMDVQTQITTGAAATCGTPQKYWGTKRIIQDGQTYDMNVPDESLIRFNTDTYSAITGSGTSGSTTDSNGNTTISSTSTSSKSKDFFEVLSSLMGEVGNRYVKGVASGNFDTDFTAAFNEILNGGTTATAGNGSSSLGNYTANSSGSYPNGGIYNGDYIGRYVKRFESGNKGSRSAGQCGNDWGRSWGSYSLTHRWGNAIRFLQKYYPDLAANLRYSASAPDIATGTWSSALSPYISSPDEVSAVWNKAIDTDGEQKFFANEHQYIADNFYKPMLDYLPSSGTTFNPDTHSRAAQELMWSWAVARGGECVGRKEFPATGIKDNNVSIPDLLAKAYQVRIAKTTTYNATPRYTNSGNTGTSEYSTLLQEVGNAAPFKMPSTTSTSTTKKITTKSKHNAATGLDDKEAAKGGFGEGTTTADLKKKVKSLLNRKDHTVHVTDKKTKDTNLYNLTLGEAKINSYEPIVGDGNVDSTTVSYDGLIPGSNGVKQSDVTSARGGYGSHRRRGGRGPEDITSSSTAEKALNKLVDLVEAIVDYVSQSNNKLDYLKDIKNQQVVLKEGDKNIAIQSPSGNSDVTAATTNKSIGRVLAEILASG